ncbi:methionyl-tRNA synthetase [Seiridium cupressi]
MWVDSPNRIGDSCEASSFESLSIELCQPFLSNARGYRELDEETPQSTLQCSSPRQMGMPILPTQSPCACAPKQELHPGLEELHKLCPEGRRGQAILYHHANLLSPHVGHLFTMVLADVLKRWEVLKNERPALLCTGTDEHGLKVQQAADLQDVPPKTLCDSNSEIFKDLARKANLSNDYFIRTTDPEHKEAVEHFWQRLHEAGYIYETKHEGWYCVSDETFYPEDMITKQVHPRTGKTYMASIESGNAVEWTAEKNYHFQMTALKDRLLEFYRENPGWVTPASRMREVVDWVENHLEDLSISRPVSRLQWGIPVPDDTSQTIYVWVDALINYITFAGYPHWTPGSEHVGGWPADVQVIGKDIVRFHCIYWPALLMALDLPLPKRILTHGHWLMDARKMSKSIGNVVNPFFAIDRWGVDTMRYFLIHSAAMESDSNYSNDFIVEKYKKGLQGTLGNFLNRVTRSKKWNVREAVQQMHDQGLRSLSGGTLEEAVLSNLINDQLQYLEALAGSVADDFEACSPKSALHKIMEFLSESNRFITSAAPWDLAGKGDDHKLQLHQVVYLSAESIRIAGILLQPFIPEKAAEILDRLGVDPGHRTLEYAKLHADAAYGVSSAPLGEGAASSVFPPIPWEG